MRKETTRERATYCFSRNPRRDQSAPAVRHAASIVWADFSSSMRVPHEFFGRTRNRFTLGISSDGKKLYIYGAGFQIEVYDAATFRYEKTWDLNNDVAGGIVVLP
jgi:hypothetical protein